MRYAISVMGDRIAPRCTIADSVVLVLVRRDVIRREDTIALSDNSLLALTALLVDYRVDTLVCGGISRESREILESRKIGIIENVVCPVGEAVEALEAHALRSGYGLTSVDVDPVEKVAVLQSPPDVAGVESANGTVDCLACTDRVCMRGEACPVSRRIPSRVAVNKEIARMLDVALDISCEHERTLCRLSELVYFCLEMRYTRIGVAYCQDLEEPTDILVRVLRRFFEVFPVSCKIGGVKALDPDGNPDVSSGPSSRPVVGCNPQGQAEVLNSLDTDINVIVGLCMGADCAFGRISESPVTTLFVKDRSLANNPIGAVYSDYYLNEASQAAARTG